MDILGFLIACGAGETSGPHPLTNSVTRIGKGAQCDIQLMDSTVSRDHAVISSRDGRHVLTNSKSKNGTTVNGIHVARRLLRHGDVVGLGNVNLVFELREHAGADLSGQERRGPRTRDPLLSLRETTTAPVATPAQQAVHTLQFIRLLATVPDGDERQALQWLAEDLAGVTDVAMVRLMWSPREESGGDGGGGLEPLHFTRGESGQSFPRERVLSVLGRVAETGVAQYFRDERFSSEPSEAGEVEAACFPLKRMGKACGSLFVDGDRLSAGTLEVVKGAMEAFAIRFSIPRSRVAKEGRAESRAPISLEGSSIVGRSPALMRAVEMSQRVALTDVPVLLTGPTGTGKEMFARLIHSESLRRTRPVEIVACNTLESNMANSELFGHEKGAFNNAVKLHRGAFERGNGGTLFLDEIGELPLELQARLLRVLQEKTVQRVGGDRPVPLDFRIVAATHRNLPDMVRKGQFREDLYYRIAGVNIELPCLAERREDIGDLAAFFVTEQCRAMGLPGRSLSSGALEALRAHPWPGNVRELRNALQHALIFGRGPEIEREDLPLPHPGGLSAPPADAAPLPVDLTLQAMEAWHLGRVLEACAGNKSQAAKKLGISRSTLYEKLGQVDTDP